MNYSHAGFQGCPHYTIIVFYLHGTNLPLHAALGLTNAGAPAKDGPQPTTKSLSTKVRFSHENIVFVNETHSHPGDNLMVDDVWALLKAALVM